MVKEKIALGFGGNVDYEIEWDSALVERLIDEFEINDGEISNGVEVRDTRSFLLSILGFMRAGLGAEVFTANEKIIEDFSKLFKYKITIGGTNTRAAITLAKIGYVSRLHVLERNEHLLRLLPREGTKIWGTQEDSLHPHLIVQFNRGTEINSSHVRIKAEKANRIIYVHNPQRLEMKLNMAFFDHPEDIEAMMISGFNSVHDRKILDRRMNELAAALKALPRSVRVFFEDGSYHVPGFTAIIQKALAGYFEVYSLNEDEFGNYMGTKVNLLDPGEIFSCLVKLGETLRVPAIVVHTKYWALAYGAGAEKYRPCLLGGINLATTRLRFGDDINPEKYRETSALGKDRLGAEFSEKIQRLGGSGICCEPSLEVPETRLTIIGLGDAFAGGFIAAMTEQRNLLET